MVGDDSESSNVVKAGKPSKRDIFDEETQRIFKLYLDRILTIEEAEIILDDLKKEYLGDTRSI